MTPEELETELERLHRASFGWALWCVAGDRWEAEDVLQTSYLKVLDGRARFDGRASLKTWLFGVIRRTAVEHRWRSWRTRLWISQYPERGAIQPDPAPDASARLVAQEEAARLRDVLRGLPVRQREVLHLVFYQELSISEAADVLGVALGTARVHYERGKRRLRALLGDGSANGRP